MNVIALHGSPNDDGLTQSLAEAALAGAAEAGAGTELIRLTDHQIAHCGQCANGWFKCREEGWCVIEDHFDEVRQKVLEADAWVLVTPVYFGDLSECVKAFTDRLRRCNTGAKGNGLEGKPVIGVAAAGGSGRGTATCLVSLDRLFSHIGGEIADLITVTRRSAEYKRAATQDAARAMVEAIGA
ncbi:MAG: flavodoxin family protein [Armatimonadota bacterium]